MQDESFNPITYLLGLLFTALVFARYYVNRQLQIRISDLRKRSSQSISQEKVILAIEPNDFLFVYSENCQVGFSQLILPLQGWRKLLNQVLRFFGKGHFYKCLHSNKTVTNFLKTLSANPSIELFLYSKLPLELVELILNQMNVLSYFCKANRRSCHDMSSQSTKHPIDVDVNTKRVVILNSNKNEYSQEDSQYFLTVENDKIELPKMAKILNKFISKNEDIDELHNELAYIKAHLERSNKFY